MDDIPPAAVARPWGPLDGELRRWAAGTLVVLLLLVAALLAWRRLAGALIAPLHVPASLAVAGLAAMVALGVRLPYWQGSRSAAWSWPVYSLPSLALLLMGTALSLPQATAAGLAALWIPLAVEELFIWAALARRKMPRRQSVPSQDAPPSDILSSDTPEAPLQEVLVEELATSTGAEPSPAADLEATPQNILQQLTRTRAEDGSEELAGFVRARFDAGQRTASLHVAFCPPFVKTPELTVRQLDGPMARVKTAQVVPFGARLDLKLTAKTDEPAAVVLEFSARSV